MAKARGSRSTASPQKKQPVEGTHEPRALAERLVAAAGPNRLSLLDDLLIHLDSQWRWPDARKIGELEKRIDRLTKHPNWWPVFRPVRGCADAEAITTLLEGGPRPIAWLASKLRKTIPAINSLAVAMKAAGKIIAIDQGIVALPGPNVKARVPATRQIVEALIATPGYRMMPAETQAAIGRTYTATGKAVWTLRQTGILDPAEPSRRGPVAFSPDTIAKIARGEAIHDGRGAILWTPPGRTAQLTAILQETKRLTARLASHRPSSPAAAGKSTQRKSKGRPPIWTGAIGQTLVSAVNAGLQATGRSKNRIIAEISTQPPFDKWSQESLRHGYTIARRHHGDSAAPSARQR